MEICCSAYQVKIPGQPHVLGDIWDFKVTKPCPVIQYADILDHVETIKAGSMIDTGTRDQYIARHVLLRSVLSRYLGIPPEEICYAYNPWGRPSVKNRGFSGTLYFNMSRTRGRVLIAVSRHFQPGIDCEKINPEIDVLGVAERYFHPAVTDYLHSIGPSEQTYQFFRLWVHTEALTKAMGIGLTQSSMVLVFRALLPVPRQYGFSTQVNHDQKSYIGLDIPSGCDITAACIFNIPNSLSIHGLIHNQDLKQGLKKVKKGDGRIKDHWGWG